MKIVIINGSARKGNTSAAIQAFAEGASDGNEIEILAADKLSIAPCKGCDACQCTNGCIDKDDTNPTIDKLVSADMIVFATPVYWWGMRIWKASSIWKKSRTMANAVSSRYLEVSCKSPRN